MFFVAGGTSVDTVPDHFGLDVPAVRSWPTRQLGFDCQVVVGVVLLLVRGHLAIAHYQAPLRRLAGGAIPCSSFE